MDDEELEELFRRGEVMGRIVERLARGPTPEEILALMEEEPLALELFGHEMAIAVARTAPSEPRDQAFIDSLEGLIASRGPSPEDSAMARLHRAIAAQRDGRFDDALTDMQAIVAMPIDLDDVDVSALNLQRARWEIFDGHLARLGAVYGLAADYALELLDAFEAALRSGGGDEGMFRDMHKLCTSLDAQERMVEVTRDLLQLEQAQPWLSRSVRGEWQTWVECEAWDVFAAYPPVPEDVVGMLVSITSGFVIDGDEADASSGSHAARRTRSLHDAYLRAGFRDLASELEAACRNMDMPWLEGVDREKAEPGGEGERG